MLRRLFRVFAHLYWSHYRRICAIGLQDEINNRFVHLMLFLLEFNLIEAQELRPLKKVIMAKLPHTVTDDIQWTGESHISKAG